MSNINLPALWETLTAASHQARSIEEDLLLAQERIKDLESYLDRIANGAQPYNDREAWSWIETARQLANEAFSPVNPQKKEDENNNFQTPSAD